MKSLILLCLFCIFNYVALSQDITISFSAKSDTVAIDSIHVLNLRTNQTVKLSGGQNLVLVNTSTNLDVFPSVDGNLMVYPNPTREYANLSFSLPASQNVVINVYNISGQLLLRQTHNLHSGQHQFRVNFPVSGMYHLSIGTEKGLLNSKVLYFGDQTGSTDIKYTGSELYDITKSQLKSTNYAIESNALEFKLGDVIHYTFFSGEIITLISDTPTKSTGIEVEFFKCVDIDGRNYKTVKIGDQVWMAENLAYLPSVSPPMQSSNTAPYYYVYGYQGNILAAAKATENYKTYGVLYNWTAAMAGVASSNTNPSGVQGICPAGWHLPSNTEWAQLENYLVANGYNFDGTTTYNRIAKSMAATTNWNSHSGTGVIGNNLSANNKSGFSALPGGGRYSDGLGLFGLVGGSGLWWSSTEYSSSSAWYRSLNYNNANMTRYDYRKAEGFCVRCVRD